MSTDEVRKTFLKFFEKKGHKIIDSSSLVPDNDSTLLFTNAGMNQFKNYFLGLEISPYTRATTAQRCVRAGGKHNDLENVGFTARHHTFFEMLGNFSFGDYFKEEAISYAWEFLTKILKLPKNRLLVTTYAIDHETFDIWNKKIGIPENCIIRIGDKKTNTLYESDNFWQMGDTGPCGPCTEIFYDHGPNVSGGFPGTPEQNGDRFVEIWNNVFMQFNRCKNGTMQSLPKPSVDTGMGIERISAIMQGVQSNYEIDIFQTLIKSTAKILKCNDLSNYSLRVISDHIRSASFLILDGVIPSNEGRGYLLRRIIRRAACHGNKLGVATPFLYKLVLTLSNVMSGMTTNLKKQRIIVEKTLRSEEENFTHTLERGMSILNRTLNNINGHILEGETVFKLYDTYGFPIDLTEDIAKERQVNIDKEGFEKAMKEQRKRARKASMFQTPYNNNIKSYVKTTFCGYETTYSNTSIVAIFLGDKEIEVLSTKDEAIIILEKTPFYAESGGQCGDSGILESTSGMFDVKDTKKQGDIIIHHGTLCNGTLNKHDKVKTKINVQRRNTIALNHSATHLLHATLRMVLGNNVVQKGSLIKPNNLRFDFSYPKALTYSQLKEIERTINIQIRANHLIKTNIMDIETAKHKGAIALFHEKYNKKVRVLSMGNFSIELCGGIHTKNTGDIGLFKIISESGISSGIRRIEAVTGEEALNTTEHQYMALKNKISKSINKTKNLEKEIQRLQSKIAAMITDNLIREVKEIFGVKVLIATLEDIDSTNLKYVVNNVKNKIGSSIILLANITSKNIIFISSVTEDITSKITANELINIVVKKVGGKGGGNSNMAQGGGGTDILALPKVLRTIQIWLETKL
ncbi:alanyl-tRNA synthetase [Candidatus Photodesmus katoptron]|uniref:Alanine--tRNA ligase n=2 Tax=Candidatus Photodesmus anomalopis TaxID=28176 RepID=S3EH06_9GAMM|nr:alanyl-tRNA synthetase, AlaRS [Candidatus Photodesmus katoptron Akat1]KEY90222.1 alanyl-tRNA synthetase [Candidatus Photodesmus katoptron]